jgi:hypothetical protein
LENIRLSVEEIKSISSCKNLTDKQAEQLADLLAIVAVEAFTNREHEH